MGVSAAPEQRRCGRSRGGGWAPLDVEAAAPAASVAVMAPALTESGPQKPENLLPPLPAGGFLSAEQAAQVCQNREVLAKFVVSASVQPSKIDEQCLRGISKELIRDVINSSKYSNGLDSLSTFGNVGDTDDLIAGGGGGGGVAVGVSEVPEDIDVEEELVRLGGFVESRKSATSSSSSSSNSSNNSYGYSLVASASLKSLNVCNSLFGSRDESEKQQQQQRGSSVSKPDAIEATKPEEPERSFIMSSDPSGGQRTDVEMGFIDTATTTAATAAATTTTTIATSEDYSGASTAAAAAARNMAIISEETTSGEALSEVPANVLGSLGVDDEDNNDDDDKDDHLDRLIGTFASEDLPADVPHMGHNVEDILQVIKSMEGAESSSGVASEQPQGVEMFPIPEGFSSFERDLLNEVDVDVMSSLCTDNIAIGSIEPVESEPQRINANLRTLQENAEQRQFEGERRSAFLLRRLRKLQARLIGRHVAEETTGVLEMAHHSVKKYLFQELSNIGPKTGAREFPEIGDSLSAFLAKIEKSCAVQSNSVSNRQRGVCRYFGGGSRDNAVAAAAAAASSGSDRAAAVSRVPVFGSRQVKLDAQEVENVAGSLAKQLHVVENNLDSDCTASSSGGESCDEMQTFNNPHQQTLPISKRASWRYAQDRAGVASRWTWLQAQIADLEYKIRQHNDLQRQVRSTKGLVILESTETVNGYSGVLPGSTGRCNAPEASELPASRTRPFAWEIYRKRKLLQVDRLHEFSKRAARPSTVRCDCDHILAACTLCTGRTDPTQPQEPIELLSVPERVARVDPSFHPVLSFPEDIVAGTHFESIMRSVDWQQKMLRGNHRMTRIKDKESGTERRSKKQQQQQQQLQQQQLQPDHRPKYTSRIKKSSSSILTARIKRKMLKGKRERSGQGRANTGNIQGLSGSATGGSRKRVAKVAPQQPEDEDDASLLSNSSKHSSPVPSPLQQHHTTTAIAEKISVKEKSSNSHGRLRQNSYDIDNIVIPYSVAASTRLEKLQYKEILTPKWRLCEEVAKMDVKNGVVHRPSQDSDVEDVSEEAIALRHERSEREENKRFMTYVNMPHQGRIRQNRRADSRADSGANTPDPMSPHASDFGGDVTSPITSPPATPSCVTQDTEQNPQQQQHNANLESHRGSSLQNAIRRRTISTMRLGKEDTASCFADDEHEIPPYDPRTFPLAEEVYDKMLQVMPDGHWQPSSGSLCSREEEKVDDQEAEMESPESDSTESACCDVEGEDPNDPEWTVADDRDTEKERIRPTAKR